MNEVDEPLNLSKYQGNIDVATIPQVLLAYGFQQTQQTKTFAPDKYCAEVRATLNLAGVGLREIVVNVIAEHHKDGTCDLIVGGTRYICTTVQMLDQRLIGVFL